MKLEEMVLLVNVEKNENPIAPFKGTDPFGNVFAVKTYMWTGLYDDKSREIYIGQKVITDDELDELRYAGVLK